MLIDAHAHLDQYSDSELDGVLDALEEHHLFTLSTSVDAASFARALTISERSRLVVPGFGIHPWEAHKHENGLPEMAHLFALSPFVGEIGLDYRWVVDEERYPAQRRVLEFQLGVARDQKKLVNVHTAGAEQDVLDLTKASGVERVIIHWYSGPTDVLREMIACGFYFTVGVEVLHSDKIREIAGLVPLDQLLTETDNPGGLRWLTAETGMPSVVHSVVSELARLKGKTSIDFADSIRANLSTLLKADCNFAPWMPVLNY